MSDIQRLCDLTLKPRTHCIPPSVVYCQFGDITLDKQNKHEKKKQPTRMAKSESVALPTELEVHKVFNAYFILVPRTGRAKHKELSVVFAEAMSRVASNMS